MALSGELKRNYETTFEIDTSATSTPSWAQLKGFTNFSKAMNEVVEQFAFLDEDGWGRSEVVGAQPTIELTGKRIVGDTAQDFIFDKQYTLGSRHVSYKMTKDGKVLTGDCTLANIDDGGGDAQALGEVSLTIHFNGAPEVSDAT